MIARLFRKKAAVPFIDYLKEPVAILTRNGRVFALNQSFSKLTDYKAEDYEGRDCREIEQLNSIWNVITACALHKSEQTARINFKNLVLDINISPIMTDGLLSHIFVEFNDVSAYVSLEKEFLKRNKELVITNALSGTFISSSNIDNVFDELLDKMLIISDLGMGWIAIRDDDRFVMRSANGLSGDFRGWLEGGGFDYLYRRFLESEEPLYVFESDDATEIEPVRQEGIVFFSAIPLRSNKEIIGFLVLASRLELKFDFDVASLFSLLGNNLSLIAEKIQLFQETQRLAVTDDLTGLHNARYFYEVLDSEIARTRRYSSPFSIVLFDIDNFKCLNDTYGHQAGDEVLRSVAEVMIRSSRAPDTVARYGGEEFIAVLPNAGKSEALHLANRIKDAVESESFLGEEKIRITISGGVAAFPEDAEDAKSLLYAADMTMYRAKAAGKKTILCYNRDEK